MNIQLEPHERHNGEFKPRNIVIFSTCWLLYALAMSSLSVLGPFFPAEVKLTRDDVLFNRSHMVSAPACTVLLAPPPPPPPLPVPCLLSPYILSPAGRNPWGVERHSRSHLQRTSSLRDRHLTRSWVLRKRQCILSPHPLPRNPHSNVPTSRPCVTYPSISQTSCISLD